MRLVQFVLSLVLISTAKFVLADTIILNSGEVVEGKIISETDGQIRVEPPDAKTALNPIRILSRTDIRSIGRATPDQPAPCEWVPNQKEQQVKALLAQGNFETAIKILEKATPAGQPTLLPNAAQLLQTAYRQLLTSLASKQTQINNANTLANSECIRNRQYRDAAQAELEKILARYGNNPDARMAEQSEKTHLKVELANAKAKVINCEDLLADYRKQLSDIAQKISDIQAKLDQPKL